MSKEEHPLEQDVILPAHPMGTQVGLNSDRSMMHPLHIIGRITGGADNCESVLHSSSGAGCCDPRNPSPLSGILMHFYEHLKMSGSDFHIVYLHVYKVVY